MHTFLSERPDRLQNHPRFGSRSHDLGRGDVLEGDGLVPDAHGARRPFGQEQILHGDLRRESQEVESLRAGDHDAAMRFRGDGVGDGLGRRREHADVGMHSWEFIESARQAANLVAALQPGQGLIHSGAGAESRELFRRENPAGMLGADLSPYGAGRVCSGRHKVLFNCQEY